MVVIRWLRIAIKGTLITINVIGGLILYVVFMLIEAVGIPRTVRFRIVRVWFWWLARVCMRMRITRHGKMAPGGMFIASNHVSWTDIPILGSHKPVIFLSKAEVGRWPVIGQLTKAGGTLFIERGGGDTAKITSDIIVRLDQGASVLIFPEGTTTLGSSVKRFFPRLFAAAIESEAMVQPVAIRYRGKDEGGTSRLAAYIDDDSFLQTMARVLAEPYVDVEVHFLEPISAAGKERKQLASEVQSRIAEIIDAKTAAFNDQ